MTMKAASTRRHGLSLVEVMITVAIISVIGGALAYFLIIGSSSWRSGDAEIQANQEARIGMMTMIKEIRQAKDGNIKTTSGTLYADNTAYDNIMFVISSDTDGDGDTIDTTGALEWSAPISYYLSGTQLVRQSESSIKIVANHVTALQFVIVVDTLKGTRVLNVTIQTVKKSADGRQMTSTLTSSVNMRN